MFFFSSKKIFKISIFLILLIAFALRIILIDIRPLHSDEAVNNFFLDTISQSGYYKYSHENYHGPSFFYITYLFTQIFSNSELGLRLSSIFSGLGIVLLPLMLRRHIGEKFVILSCLFLSISPTLVFYNRYAIHESFFVFCNLLYFISLYLWAQEKRQIHLFLIFISLALSITTKETFIISAFIFTTSFIILNISRLKEILPKVRQTLLPVSCFILILIVLFSGFFLNFNGLQEMFLAIPQWISRNESDVGHFKPCGYYLSIFFGSKILDLVSISYWKKVLIPVEPQFYISLVLFPLFFLNIKNEIKSIFKSNSFKFFLLFSLIGILVVYSIPIKYKTPWLIINISVLWNILLAYQFQSLLDLCKNQYSRLLTFLLIFMTFLGSLLACYYYNFKVPFGNDNPLSYVHTQKGALELAKDLTNYCNQQFNTKVLMGSGSYWPLPYYLRNSSCKRNYLHIKDENYEVKDYKVLVLDRHIKLNHKNFQSKYYRLSDNQEVYVWYRTKLR